MISILYGHNIEVAEWVFSQLGIDDLCSTDKAIGIVKDGKLIGGVVYNNYRVGSDLLPLSMEMSIATIDKSWISRNNLRALFAYPFIQANVKRVQATTRADNAHVRRFLARLGFTFEGIGREAHPLGGDAAVYSMLKHECIWR